MLSVPHGALDESPVPLHQLRSSWRGRGHSGPRSLFHSFKIVGSQGAGAHRVFKQGRRRSEKPEERSPLRLQSPQAANRWRERPRVLAAPQRTDGRPGLSPSPRAGPSTCSRVPKRRSVSVSCVSLALRVALRAGGRGLVPATSLHPPAPHHWKLACQPRAQRPCHPAQVPDACPPSATVKPAGEGRPLSRAKRLGAP